MQNKQENLLFVCSSWSSYPQIMSTSGKVAAESLTMKLSWKA
jgi:hypothetical protein